ncbi:TonB-dependent receptor [Prosthecobacter sp.]|uniref:TonB-dependent receptor family protein n=1 Tax=Prosthecobacter sp. TaxID=1965333 RepID=UPI002AB88780|nr:TonB-dependent receptor [Prosthecobacter sp.]MDZ4406159.1 TonB-dependent receptor [Prosthecobacter sp.]
MNPNSPSKIQCSVGPVAAAAALLFLAFASHARSQTVSNPVTKPAANATELDAITIYGEAESDYYTHSVFPEAVEGTKIFAGKRATIIDLDALPKVQANNYRQALAQTPGLLFSEETTPLVSIGYRGLGEPHRFQFMQVLKDGIPIHADPFGYPEAYYTPPLDVVDRIEFIRGGGGLMYGSQPGGAFNYITYMPRRDKAFGFRTQNIFGTDNLFSSYTSADGTVGNLGYYGYFNHRSSDGFRNSNSDYRLDGGNVKLVYHFDDDTRLIFGVDMYEEEHGEPGGLTAAAFASTPEMTTKFNDRFKLRRYIGSAELQHQFQPGTELSVKAWGGYYQRWSKRQRTSAAGAAQFGTVPTLPNAATNAIENQEFYTLGIEPRIRHDWEAWGNTHTLAAGMQLYYNFSPRVDKRGATPGAEDGIITADSRREVFYGSLFLENKFTFGRLTITPGFRLEMINQNVHTRNFAPATGLFVNESSKSVFEPQPLFGLGLAYDLGHETSLYANVSQSYRTTVFSESIVAQPGTTTTDIGPSLTWSYELGVRGKPATWLTFDTSIFLIDMDNRFGTTGTPTIIRSVGRSINYGWDGAFELDLIGLADSLGGTQHAKRAGSLNWYANVTLLEAELYGGPANGGTPQYAPDYMVRSGLIYKYQDRVKIGFLGTLVSDHNAQDGGPALFDVPSYMTWDLTAEVKVNEHFTVMAGLNNVFDESYYARVRTDGIDPAYGRNFYVGGSLTF